MRGEMDAMRASQNPPPKNIAGKNASGSTSVTKSTSDNEAAVRDNTD